MSLRQVLDAFTDHSGPVSLKQLARELQMDPGVLEDMVGFWVRKGRLRETSNLDNCNTCGAKSGCPFIVKLPRRYELVTDDDPSDDTPPCSCCT